MDPLGDLAGALLDAYGSFTAADMPAWLKPARVPGPGASAPVPAPASRGRLQVHAGKGGSVLIELTDRDSGESVTGVLDGGRVEEVIAAMRDASRRSG